MNRVPKYQWSFIRFIATFKRSGAAEARWAHNPKVGGSKPLFAILIFSLHLKRTRETLIVSRFKFYYISMTGWPSGLRRWF